MKLSSQSKRNLLVVIAGTLALAAACSKASGESPREPRMAAAHAPRTGPVPRLVFFMNPNGMPCQMQDRILREMAAELNGRAEIVYYKTTEPTDIPQFGRYGIRSLPALLLADANGAELRRATPGIQSADQIRRLVGP